MAMGSFILGIIVGIILTLTLILIYIIHTFGMGFIPILLNLLDGNVSFNDMMSLGQYFGYL